MSHEIERRNGQASMMYAGDIPWHGLGQAVETEVTAAAAIKLAGLDWKVEKQPIFLKGKKEIHKIPVIGSVIPNQFAIVRPEDNQVMGIVSKTYEIIQNSECFDFMDAIVGEGQAIYHTAGSLYDGRILFLTVKLPSDAKIGPDQIDKYLLLSSSHDGSLSLSVRWTPVRVVCANTLEFAIGDSFKNQTIKIKHSRNYRDKVSEARRILELTEAYYHQMEKEFQKLLDTTFTHSDMQEFTANLLPAEGNVSTQTANKRNTLIEMFHTGKGNENVANTKWAAYNAVTEFADHVAKYRTREGVSEKEARMNGVIFGTGSELKQRAYKLLVG